jgi:hypothetical protein
VVALTFLGAWLLMGYFIAHQPATPAASELTATPAVPPTPRLQTNPRLDLSEKREAEDAVLQTYGWVDRAAGTVRIPISRAMDLLAERGRPAPKSVPQGDTQADTAGRQTGPGKKQ